MNLILDTHAFIWFVEGSMELSQNAKNSILDTDNIKYVSVASFWEMSIKVNQGKLSLKSPFESIMEDIVENGFILLNVNFEHLGENSKLPWHHRDPFDRLIISQSNIEGMSIISRDSEFKNYTANNIW
jgi:PIN domain nuclease of toxin-antitoxin system